MRPASLVDSLGAIQTRKCNQEIVRVDGRKMLVRRMRQTLHCVKILLLMVDLM